MNHCAVYNTWDIPVQFGGCVRKTAWRQGLPHSRAGERLLVTIYWGPETNYIFESILIDHEIWHSKLKFGEYEGLEIFSFFKCLFLEREWGGAEGESPWKTPRWAWALHRAQSHDHETRTWTEIKSNASLTEPARLSPRRYLSKFFEDQCLGENDQQDLRHHFELISGIYVWRRVGI